MAVIVVTRLRLRDPALREAFFPGASASLEQAIGTPGNLGADALAEAHDTWWTVSSWETREAMRGFVGTEPHLSTMAGLDDWCDEATFADWEQPSGDLPDWTTCHARVVAEGQVAELSHASPANATRDFPPPVVPPVP